LVAGIALIGFAVVLLVIVLFLAFGTVPGLSARGSGYQIGIEGQAERTLPRTPASVRNILLGATGLAAIGLGASGAYLLITGSAAANALTRLQVEQGIERNREEALRVLNSGNVAGPTATPTTRPVSASSTRTPTPRPGVPTPTPIVPLTVRPPTEAFAAAVQADRLGNATVAAHSYTEALAAGLSPQAAEVAQLQIGLLALKTVQQPGGSKDLCANGIQQLTALSKTTKDDATARTASDALHDLQKQCS
jgi:hypothetical protein